MVTEMNEQELQARRKKTEMVLANIYNLPAMSGIMVEVSKLLDDPATSTQRLSSMIGKDQGLATKILSIANSPLYGLPRKVSTIDFAILIIGYQDVKNIVVALSMIESFKNKTDKNLNQREFWLHSIVTGNASRRIAEDLGYRISGECFVAGLLHDLGIPVMHKYFHSIFEDIISKARQNGSLYLEHETEMLGYNHEEIGSYLANKWNLPQNLCEAIKYHHTPNKSDNNKVMTSIVHLADYMTQKLELGTFYWDENIELDESVIETLKFGNQEELDKFVEKYRPLFEDEIRNFKF